MPQSDVIVIGAGFDTIVKEIQHSHRVGYEDKNTTLCPLETNTSLLGNKMTVPDGTD